MERGPMDPYKYMRGGDAEDKAGPISVVPSFRTRGHRPEHRGFPEHQAVLCPGTVPREVPGSPLQGLQQPNYFLFGRDHHKTNILLRNHLSRFLPLQC